MGRYKSLIGPRLRSRGFAAQQAEAAIRIVVLNRMLAAGCPRSVSSQKMAALLGRGWRTVAFDFEVHQRRDTSDLMTETAV